MPFGQHGMTLDEEMQMMKLKGKAWLLPNILTKQKGTFPPIHSSSLGVPAWWRSYCGGRLKAVESVDCALFARFTSFCVRRLQAFTGSPTNAEEWCSWVSLTSNQCGKSMQVPLEIQDRLQQTGPGRRLGGILPLCGVGRWAPGGSCFPVVGRWFLYSRIAK